jgi:para-nitrobenzyl esterase
MSVAALMLSPLAEGLFHRAISQSGSSILARYLAPLSASGDLDRALASGQTLTRNLGCHQAPDKLSAMRAKTAEEVLAAAPVLEPFFPNTRGVLFLPVADDKVLSKTWLSPQAKGKWYDAPLIVGHTTDEGLPFFINPEYLQGYQSWVREMFGDRAEELLALFPADSPEAIYPAFNKLITAVGWACASRFVADARSSLSSPTYMYQFARVPDWENKAWGAFHGLDIGYVFGGPRLMMMDIEYEDEDRKLSEMMMGYWTTFAATGDPNGAGRPHWPVYDSARDEYLEFDCEATVKSGMFQEVYDCLR